MQDKYHLFFKILLNRFHPGARETYLKALSVDEVKEIFKQVSTANDPSIALRGPGALLANTHYSWLAPVMRSLPSDMQKLTLASLPKAQAVGLAQLLKIPEGSFPEGFFPEDFFKEPPDRMKQFVLNQLFRLWNPPEALPTEFLPVSPLTPLLNFSKQELAELCDYLPLYDLADAIRHIVDKKYLTAIYLCLTPGQQQFLRHCLHRKEKISAPRLNIEKWDQKAETLRAQLHQRGLWRLGKILCGQDSSFVWHIVHRLDTGRGAMVSKYYAPGEIPGVTGILVQQLLFLINFLKQKGKV